MTDRDISVLNFINLVGMCRTEHIRKLFFNGLTNTTWDRRANKLVEYKELKRFRSGIYNREYVYYIENKPNERILRHDMYITELVYKLLLLGVEVLYLDRNIKLGNIISDGYMIIRYKKNIVGNYSNYNTIIPAGSMFFVETVVREEQLPDSSLINIKADEIPYSFPVTMTSTYGNSIMPGNYIDIIVILSKLIYGKLNFIINI